MADLIVYFKKPADWAEPVNIHYWEASQDSGGGIEWPGVPMTAEGEGWYGCRWLGTNATSMVSNDGHGRQTGNLRRESSGWYADGQRSDQQNAASPAEVARNQRATPDQRGDAAVQRQREAGKESGSSPDFREETIYFLMTTRFYDNDPSNNFFCRDRIKFDSRGEPGDPHWRGDFKGLIQRLYYGEEIEFMKGAPPDVFEENDTLDRTGGAYYGDHLTDERIGQTQANPPYQHIKRLNQIRQAIPALQKATMSQVQEWGAGMSSVRDYNDGESYAAVELAIGSDQDVNVGSVRGGTYRDAVTGNETSAPGGSLSFHVRGNSAGIYVIDGPGKIGTNGTYLR